MHEKIDVLDHGLVRVVDFMGGDLSISRNARVSYDAAWRAGEDEGSDAKLIRFLLNNKHNTPFEATVITLEIKAPIFVLRQWHRHRTQSYNELSARYKELPGVYYVPSAEAIGVQSKGNKQCRDISGAASEANESARTTMQRQNAHSYSVYKALLADGVPRELARSVLPFAMYSHMFTTVNLHNLFGFLRERLHTHAQYEIRVYAQAILELIAPIAPIAVEAFKTSLKNQEGYDL